MIVPGIKKVSTMVLGYDAPEDDTQLRAENAPSEQPQSPLPEVARLLTPALARQIVAGLLDQA